MNLNKNIYTVKFNSENSECSFTGGCEILVDNQMKITILNFNKVDLSVFMEWSRSYSESITGRIPTNLRKDVYLTDMDNKQTILYNCILGLIDFGEIYADDAEKITFEVKYDTMGGSIITYKNPVKLSINISNLTEKQAAEIEQMFKKWQDISDNNDSRWTSFFINKDFKPKIKY
jgi:hypothetical protein